MDFNINNNFEHLTISQLFALFITDTKKKT